MGGDQEATGNNSRMEGLCGSDGRVEEVEDAPPRMVLEKTGQLSSGQGVRLNEANVGSSKGVVVRTDGECRVMGTSQVAPSFAVAHGKFRCSRVLDEDFIEREGIYDRGCRLLVECESTFGVTVAPVRELHRRQCWVRPARGWVKLNVDAAVGVSDDRASVGGVIRGADGEWIFGFTRFVGRCTVLLAELWAVLDGLRHAWAVNCRRVELETDNKEVERILKHDSESLGASALVMAIHEWLRKDWVVFVRHVPRECNGVADSLAALGRDYGWQGSTFPAPPRGIVHRLDDERQQWLSTRPVQRFVDDPG
ncbi:hypothetical protein V6N11_011449 [Hibiscus sabdariffa]|uniref:RNase H type-1 domain-containing protein n=1 Tax=Hibiscus sabdariffa TaxID=183260 RepID=A0ABR2S8B2_9ROSI